MHVSQLIYSILRLEIGLLPLNLLKCNTIRQSEPLKKLICINILQ